jgi:ferritin heavy chain
LNFNYFYIFNLFLKALLDLHKVASSHNDSHLTNFLEEEYLKEQAESMNKLAKMVTNLQRVGEGLGVYVFDKDLQE